MTRGGWRTIEMMLAVVALLVATWTYGAHEADEAREELVRLDPNMAAPSPGGEFLWYDARAVGVEGRAWEATKSFYDRLPAKAETVVREPVWKLSLHSAGMAVHFVSDSNRIAARWTVRNGNLAMPHMPATGVSGLDLYVKDQGVWRWLGTGRPDQSPTNEKTLATDIPHGSHEYLLYLPLYNGIESLAIGIPKGAALAKAPAQPKPLCMYGTSITHGGCASRPGMAYPALLGRRLGYPVINLGFSGNGTMDPEMGELLAELDVSAYVLDCAPNMDPALLSERVVPFVLALRKARPETPIVLVENIAYQQGAFLPKSRESYENKNQAVRAAYDTLMAEGIGGLFYVEGKTLLGTDGEATVDGTHPTDLGFMRMADALEPALRRCLGL